MPDRESIWSVSSETRTLYFRVFTALFLVGMALLVVREVQAGDDASVVERIMRVWESAAAVAIASAAVSLAGIETGGLIMLWREKLEHVREARREEGRVEGREEGRELGLAEGLAEGLDKGRAEERAEREKERAEAMAWYERLEAARREGKPFDEPPPFIEANGRSDNGRSA